MSDIYSRPALIFTEDKQIEKQIEKSLSTLQYKVDHTIIESEVIKLLGEKEYFLVVIVEKPKRQLEILSFYKRIIASHPQYKNSVIFVSESIFGVLAEEVKMIGCELIPKPFYAENLATALESMRERGLFKENRAENRYNWIGETVINHGEAEYKGRTMDISMNGIKMYYQGTTPNENDVLKLYIPDMDHTVEAKVTWSYKVGEKAMIGVKLESTLPLEAMKKAIPFAP